MGKLANNFMELLSDYPYLKNYVFNDILTSLFNYKITSYTTTGGVYEYHGAMLMISEIITTALQLAEPGEMDAALENWPFRTNDGAYFFPVPNAVIIYSPGAFGYDVRYFLAMEPWPVNVASDSLTLLTKYFKGTPASTFVDFTTITIKLLIMADRTYDAIKFAKEYNFNAEQFIDVISGRLIVTGKQTLMQVYL